MSDFPNIINSKIINTSQDVFWLDVQLPSSPSAHYDTVIISQHFEDGSAEQVQLQKMMQACKLSETDYLVIRMNEGEQIAWHKLRDAIQPKVVITLGIPTQALGISANLHMDTTNEFNGCTWIPTHSLTELEKHPEAKKDLWLHALKPVFVDKA
jgi:BarA-like signal transduction histidine kinase